MAKTSAVERNLKRIRMAKRFDIKRKKLKAITKNKKLPLNERFAAQLKLSKLPKIFKHSVQLVAHNFKAVSSP